MVEARVVAVAPLGETEVGALAAVAGDDVADEHGAVVARVPDHGLVLLLGAEARVDLAADAVEVAIHGGRVLAPADAAGALHGASVHAGDADVMEDAPELWVAQALQHRLARPRDLRRRVRGEPHGRPAPRRRAAAAWRRDAATSVPGPSSAARPAPPGGASSAPRAMGCRSRGRRLPALAPTASRERAPRERARRWGPEPAWVWAATGRRSQTLRGAWPDEEDAAQAGRGCGCHHRAREQKRPRRSRAGLPWRNRRRRFSLTAVLGTIGEQYRA